MICALVLMLVLSGCHAPAPEGPAAEALATLKDPARSFQERMEAGVRLVELGPEAKSVEPALLRTLLNRKDLAVDPSDPLARQLSGDGAVASDTLRYFAAQALSGFVPDPGSIPSLISLLRDENILVQFEAGYALASLGVEARAAVPSLSEMLRGGDADRAEIAALVLARIAPDPAIEPAVPLLVEALQGSKGWVAGFHAAVALLKLGREADKARAVLRDDVHLSFMLPLLKHKQPMVRLQLCEALMLSGPPQRDHLDLLRQRAAEDPDPRVREAARKALRAPEMPER